MTTDGDQIDFTPQWEWLTEQVMGQVMPVLEPQFPDAISHVDQLNPMLHYILATVRDEVLRCVGVSETTRGLASMRRGIAGWSGWESRRWTTTTSFIRHQNDRRGFGDGAALFVYERRTLCLATACNEKLKRDYEACPSCLAAADALPDADTWS